MPAYDALDEALESVADAGPDLRSGLTNHAPMAVEALCAMDRSDAVPRWLDRYREQLMPWPARESRVESSAWREALGKPERASDWRAFFANQLEDASWREVLDRWGLRLAPGICASAAHGVIRVGHAARGIALTESSARRAELADALASWASTYQELPTDRSPRRERDPAEAIFEVAVVPPGARKFAGTITSSLEALGEFPPFAGAIALAKLDGDPAARISELTETFARVYLANAKTPLAAIVFVHGVTCVTALRSMLPHLGAEAAAESLRYAWQAGCGLYAAFGERPVPMAEIEPPRETSATLVDMAIANGDEHAIKFTEACLREHARNRSPAYLAAARHGIEAL